MASQIFVNLPVKELARSVAFFTKLGYTFNAQFTDENATCMIIDENIHSMLIVEPYFQSFLPPTKTISDAKKTAEVLVALSVESKEAVTRLCETAFAAGAGKHMEAKDYGFMFQWGFEDLDGHVWEYFWMDPAHVQK